MADRGKILKVLQDFIYSVDAIELAGWEEAERAFQELLANRESAEQRITDVIAELEKRANGDRTANSSSNIRKQTLEEVISLLKDYTKKGDE